MDETTRVLRDREAIERLIVRYAWAVDDMDADALMEVFAPDARLSLDGGAFTADGAAEIRAFYEWSFARRIIKETAHQTSNVLIEVSGDDATVRTLGISYVPRGDKLVLRGIRYADRFSRRDGEWKMSERNHVCIWQFSADRDAAGAAGLSVPVTHRT